MTLENSWFPNHKKDFPLWIFLISSEMSSHLIFLLHREKKTKLFILVKAKLSKGYEIEVSGRGDTL